MSWSFKIATFAGIPLRIHVTFVLLLLWVGLTHWLAGRSLVGVLFILAIFGSVVLHELGHALVARRYGIKTRDITLLPIGGVARLDRMPDVPLHELLVALAGPAVNLVIAGALYLLPDTPFLHDLTAVNLALAAFNMLPAFPMDGGRVLRALLAMAMSYARATRVAAALGQLLAMALGFVGLFGNPLLLFIALFVWIGAGAEASLVEMRTALGNLPVREAMLTDFRTLRPDDKLEHAVQLILAGSQADFPVVGPGGEVLGILRRLDLMTALQAHGDQALVSQAMSSELPTVVAQNMLERVFMQMNEKSIGTVPVLDNGRLVGLLTLENIGEFLSIQKALKAAPTDRPRAVPDQRASKTPSPRLRTSVPVESQSR